MTVKHQPATPRAFDAIPEGAARTGLQMARKIFAKRGDHSEAHITEEELAVMLAAAFHLGTTHRDDAYPRLVEVLRDLRKAIDQFGGHGMPGFRNRAEAYIVLTEADTVLHALGEAS